MFSLVAQTIKIPVRTHIGGEKKIGAEDHGKELKYLNKAC